MAQPLNTYSVLVEVSPLDGVADPQGTTIERSLPQLGFEGVSGVRVGRAIRFQLAATSLEAAQQQAAQMCERLLANPVIEQSNVDVRAAEPAGSQQSDAA